MYIHLLQYEPFTLAGDALYVRQLPQDGAGLDLVVRGGAAAAGVAGYAAYDFAGVGARWRDFAGAAGEMLAMDSTSLTRTLAIMRRRGWVAERRGNDHRERLLRISRGGAAKLKC